MLSQVERLLSLSFVLGEMQRSTRQLTISLAFLAPNLVKAAVEGRLPAATPDLALRWKRAICKGWMVVFAVRYEPVSGWQFPANREFYREFCDSGALRADFVARNRCAAATS